MLSYFERVCDSHNHNTHNGNTNYKIKYSRTTYKVAYINVKDTKLWNELQSHLQTCSTIYQFKYHLKKIFLLVI